MLIARRSPRTGLVNAREIAITPKRYEHWLSTPPRQRELIQVAFPELSAEDREFILTGYTPEDWNEMFPAEDDNA